MKKIDIVGAGLAGSLLAIYLARQNYDVHVYEKRSDMRESVPERGRSINLAISRRGVYALEKLGIADQIMAKSTPMYGRMIHDMYGNSAKQTYGRNQNEYISAISRSELNIDLLNLMCQEKNVKIKFNHRITDVNIESGQLTVFDAIQEKHYVAPQADLVIATDGAPSAVRQAMISKGVASFSTDFLSHGYKELLLDAEFGKPFDKNCLHIWPRDDFMLIALPNFDGSFTCTLFLSMKEKENSFEHLRNKEQIDHFFQKYFPNIKVAIPDLSQQFLSNPIGELATLRGGPWYYKDKLLLLGDAAHAIVPFFGQGMNCAFEDCTVFSELLDKNKNDWQQQFSDFFVLRKQNADAIAQMAIDNFFEMGSYTGKKEFLLHKQVEMELMHRYGDRYISRYVMISFTRHAYKLAQICGLLQKDFLERICRSISCVQDLDWEFVDKELQVYLTALNREKELYGFC